MPFDSSRFKTAAIVLVTLVIALASVRAIAQTAVPKPAASGLTIAGDFPKPLTLALADLKAMPRTTVTAEDQGTPIKYDGVLVSELLTRAGAPMGRGMGGNGLMAYVRAVASDGYEVLFSLGELD